MKALLKVGTVLRGVSVCVQVLKTPAALAYHGVGPMVSARVHDLHILWNRTFQLFDLCTKVCLPHTLARHDDVVVSSV